MAKEQKGRARAQEQEPAAVEPAACAFPWERQLGEGPQAYARFLAYRDMDATVRSQRKVASICAISEQLVQRWSKRYCWVRRAIAYDNWMLELGDRLGKHAVMGHKARLLRFAGASLDKAELSLKALDSAKCQPNEIVQLAKAGMELGDRALGLEPKANGPSAPTVVVQTGIQYAAGSEPKWATRQVEAKRNEVLVNVEQKVLAEPNERPAKAVGPIDGILPVSQVPTTKRLLERVIEAPKAPADL